MQLGVTMGKLGSQVTMFGVSGNTLKLELPLSDFRNTEINTATHLSSKELAVM